jgi:hypothetical protein
VASDSDAVTEAKALLQKMKEQFKGNSYDGVPYDGDGGGGE